MSLEAINEIRGAEEAGDQARADAKVKAQKLLADAEREGKELLAKGRAESAEKAADAMAKAEREGEIRRTAVMADAKRDAEALKQQAEGRMDAAVKAIIERVVES